LQIEDGEVEDCVADDDIGSRYDEDALDEGA
jgi:hypothetical protein